MEFSPKLGIIPEANRQARSTLFIFIILPVLLMLIVPPLVAVFLTIPSQADELLLALSNAASVILLLGVPAFIIAWFFGLYQKGSLGRLVLGLVYAAFLVLYIFEILVTSNLKQGFIDLSIHFNYDLFVTLMLIVPLFVALGTVGEIIDERNAWKRSLGLQVKSKPLNPESRSLDFDPRIGKIGDGAKLSLRAYVLFIIVPAVVLTLLSGTLDDLNFQNSAGLANAFKQVLDAIIVFSIFIVILSFFRGFYPKGTFARVVFGVMVVVIILFLLQAAFLNGGLESAFLDSGVIIDLGLVLLVLLLYAAIGLVGVLAELIDNRRKWAKGMGRKVRPLVQDERPNLLTDFRIRYAKFVLGTKESKKNARKYYIWPALILVITIAVLMTSNDPTFIEALPAMQGLVTVILLFGLPVIIAQFFRGSNPKGAISRWVFGLIAAAFIALWYNKFWGVYLTALADAMVNPGNDPAFASMITLFSGLIYVLILIPALFKAIWYTVEYLMHRREWETERAKLQEIKQETDMIKVESH